MKTVFVLPSSRIQIKNDEMKFTTAPNSQAQRTPFSVRFPFSFIAHCHCHCYHALGSTNSPCYTYTVDRALKKESSICFPTKAFFRNGSSLHLFWAVIQSSLIIFPFPRHPFGQHKSSVSIPQWPREPAKLFEFL